MYRTTFRYTSTYAHPHCASAPHMLPHFLKQKPIQQNDGESKQKRNNARETAMNTGAIRGERFRYGLKQTVVRHFSGTSANIFAVRDIFFFVSFCKKKKKRIFGNV
ncbi:hypothetical protein [Bacteroides heparinolyticus]|uniref:hypothetical protein n=1 Tax=Prevotella heparinolytica TaxID=28113 RepID=UPI0035A05392